jgi:glutamyl-tRNA reductase
MYNLKVVSISYKTAPVSIREQLALSESQSKDVLLELKNYDQISDLLIVSTCNRTEVYYSAPFDYSEAIIRTLVRYKIFSQEDFSQYFLKITNSEEAVKRLFEVAIGLESQVLGDIQIINQVKKAYQLSADLDLVGPFLHRLLHTIFFTNKKVVQETTFRSGAASTAYAAVELVNELALGFANPHILVLGIGEIGADVCRNLKESNYQNFTIINRTYGKAAMLAIECNAQVIEFEHVWEAIAKADIIISSINTGEYFIDKSQLIDNQLLTHKYFIDLSMPRSIDPTLEEINGILVYNIDQINVKVSEALAQRMAAIPTVKLIVEESLAEFGEWSKEMEVSPTIQKLKNTLEQIRQEEIARHLKKLSEEEAARIELITKNMMQKIIKLPTLQLKAACKRGEAETLIDVLNDLFNLEKQSVSK